MANNAVRVKTVAGWVDLAYVAQGPQGPAGPTGPGVPVGGVAGQILSKASGVDYATQWANPAAAGPAGGDLQGTYPNPTLKPRQGAGRVVGAEGAASGNMAGSSNEYQYEGKTDGTQPFRLNVTPSVNSWWPVSAMGLVKVLDGNWYPMNASIKCVPTDALGSQLQTYRVMHYGGLPADWVAAPISAMFALTAGVAYTVSLVLVPLTGTWNYYRGGNQHAWIASSGVFPR